MTNGTDNPDSKGFIERIEAAEHQVEEYRIYLRKLKTRLYRTRKSLSSKPAVAAQITSLLSDLQGIKAEPARPVLAQLVESLESELRRLRRRSQDDFPSDLRQCCEGAGLAFKALPDGFGVGPFFVAIDLQKDIASFQYAKVLILKDPSLSASRIVARANSLKAAVIDPPVDLPTFQTELEEAMRVAAARRDKRLSTTELRAELPAVFRELSFIRGSAANSGTRTAAGGGYSLSRFVVELKQFIQSDRNVHAEHQFRLEPAVIENSKNPKKSIFIPQDVLSGFGEGTYYQAIVSQYQ